MIEITSNDDKIILYREREERAQLYEELNQPELLIPFFLKELNDRTRQGLPRGVIGSVISPTGVGKTMFLCNQTRYLAQKGYNVLYIAVEENQRDILQKIYQSRFQMTDQQVRATKWDSKMRAHDNGFGEIIIAPFDAFTCTAKHIEIILDHFKKEHGINIDAVMLDYVDKAATLRLDRSRTPEHIWLGTIAADFNDLARRRGDIVILMAQQTNRSGSQAFVVGNEAAQGSIQTIQNGYFVLTIQDAFDEQDLVDQRSRRKNGANSKTPQRNTLPKIKDAFTFAITKNRRGPKNEVFQVGVRRDWQFIFSQNDVGAYARKKEKPTDENENETGLPFVPAEAA